MDTQRQSCKFGRGLLFVRLLFLLLLVGCSEGIYSGTLVFEGDHHFEAGTRLPGDVFVRAGTAEFAEGALVAGSVYQLGGSLIINGRIGGDLVLLDGDLTLGPQAVVDGDLRTSGGMLQQAETAVVRGEQMRGSVEMPLDQIEDRTTPGDWARTLIGALLLAALGALFVRLRPRPVATVAETAVAHWPAAAALGGLALLVLPPLLVMMAFTVVLLPLVVLLLLLLFLVVGYGFVALGFWSGQMAARRWGRPRTAAAATFWGTLLLLLLFTLPLLGAWLALATAVPTFGAVLLTRCGTRPFSPAQNLDPSDDRDSYARPAQEPPD